MSQSAPSYAHALPSTVAQCETALSGPGKALSPDLRAEFETSLDADLSNVRVHTTDATAAATARANARAFAFGDDIGFASGAFQPDTPRGRSLIGHELVHVVQSRRGASGARGRAEAEADALAARVADGSPVQVQRSAPEGPAFALDDYFFSSPNIQAMTLSQVEDDIAEITEYLDRQFETNEETIRLQQALEALRARRAELLRGTTQQPPARRQRRSGRRRRQPTEDTPLPADAPRVLRERTSRPLTDPDEIRAETDRIVVWLNRSDLSREDRAILQDELRALAPQSEEARRIDAARRHSARIRRAFQSRSTSGDQTATLRHQLGIVESIYTDPAEPQVRFIVHEGERVRISVEHANELRQRSTQALRNAIRNARDQAASAMRRYRFQQRLNEDQPIVSTIAGWLGGVDDPWTAVIRAKTRADAGVRNATIHLDENRLVRAVGPIVQAAEAAARLKRAVDAWRDGLISGAGLAVGVLTFVRDASAAIATAIAAVVAAPVVAGYAAGLGLGATGTAVATTAGTGLVVGTGSGVAGGGAEYAGQRIAGASHSEASSAAGTEARRRFAEGAAAGVGGGVTRVAGQAFRVGGTATHQVARRGAAEAVGNFAGTTTGGVLQGQDLDVATGRGLRTAGISVLGNTVGSLGHSVAAQEGLEFVTNAGLGTADTLAQGGTWQDAALNLTVMTASQGILSRSAGRQGEIAGYERAATRTGQRHRSRARSTIGAVGLGIQTALPPSGFGGSAPLDLPTTPIVQRTQTSATPEFTTQTAPARPTSTQTPTSRTQRPAAPTSETQSAPQQTRQQSVDPSLELDTRPWQQRRTSEVQDPSLRTQRGPNQTAPQSTTVEAHVPTQATDTHRVFGELSSELGLTPATGPAATAQQRAAGLPAVTTQRAAPASSTAPGMRESAGARATQRGIRRHDPQIAELEAMGHLDPAHHSGATGSARTPRSITTAIRADTAEIMTYHERLARGEIGILAPVGSNIAGADSATAVRLPNGDYEIVVIDTKSKVSPTSQFGRVGTTLKQTWRDAVADALAPGRLSLGDPVLESRIRAAWAAGRFRIARDTVDFSPAGQGRVRLDN